jgi:hypothetical protein
VILQHVTNKYLNMKTIKIKKSSDLSENSKIYLHVGDKKKHIRGYESYSITINPGEEFFASHQWTSSNKYSYDQINDGSSFIIRPRLGKKFAFINLVILMICFVIFYFTRSRWSFFPLLPSAIFGGLFLTVLKDKYLIIESLSTELQNS